MKKNIFIASLFYCSQIFSATQSTGAFQTVLSAMIPAFNQSSDSVMPFSLSFIISTNIEEFPEIPASEHSKIIREHNGKTEYNPNFPYDLIDDEKNPKQLPDDLPLPSDREIEYLSSVISTSQCQEKILAHELSVDSLKSLVLHILNPSDHHVLSSRIIAFTVGINQAFYSISNNCFRDSSANFDREQASDLFQEYQNIIYPYLIVAQKIWLSYALVHNCLKTNKFQLNHCGIAIKKRQRYVIANKGDGYHPIFTYTEHDFSQAIYGPDDLEKLQCHLGYRVENGNFICFPIPDDALCVSSLVPCRIDVPYAAERNKNITKILLKGEQIISYTGWVLSKPDKGDDLSLSFFHNFSEMRKYRFNPRILEQSTIVDCDIPIKEIWESFCASEPDVKTFPLSRANYILPQNRTLLLTYRLMDLERIEILRSESPCSDPIELEILEEAYAEEISKESLEQLKDETRKEIFSESKEYQSQLEKEWKERLEMVLANNFAPKPQGRQTPKKFIPTEKQKAKAKNIIEEDVKRAFLSNLKDKAKGMRSYCNALVKTAEKLGIPCELLFGKGTHFSISTKHGKQIPIWRPHGKRKEEATLYIDHETVRSQMIGALLAASSC